jgi:hypothetical protein
MYGHCDEFMEKGIHIFILSHDKQRYRLKQPTYLRSAARDLAWLHRIYVKIKHYNMSARGQWFLP